MTKIIIVTLLAASVLAFNTPALAAEKGDPKAQLQELVGKVRAKLKGGKVTAETLAPELKQFDELLAEHKDEKTDAVAEILVWKANLYSQVLDDMDKATELIKQLKTDFPETKQGKNADKMLESYAKQAEAKKIQAALVVGSKFPDFGDVKDLDGKALSLADYKGKVVLVDFWATWCGPCVAELPNVLKAYEAHNPKGFDIVGISLDSSKDKLTKFIEDKKMPWRQYFDGLGWGSKLGAKYGINSIPATYLLDKEGKIVAKNLRGDALEKAVAEALGK
jgi:thiol-disulfide isomerase/thioredoxin